MQAPTEKRWMILGRVLRVVGGPPPQAEHGVAMDKDEQARAARLEQRVVDVDATEAAAAASRGVYEFDSQFAISVAPPPRVTILTLFNNGPLDDEGPDMYPYIIASGPFCVLVHTRRHGPYHGTDFRNEPTEGLGHLAVVRHFRRDDGGLIAGTDELLFRPSCKDGIPSLRSIESVGLLCNDDQRGSYRVAELMVSTRLFARLAVCFRSDSRNCSWSEKSLLSPLVPVDHIRKWVPHGTVAIKSSLMWFDLSWGILSYDLDLFQQPGSSGLNFHHLPPGRALPRESRPRHDIHTRRCITVSNNLVRYVEVIPNGQAATVSMWYLRMGEGDEGWQWIANYAVSFDDIWNDRSYRETGLPRNVPVLAAVSPVNSDVVYFALDQRLFGINVPARRVEHHETYALMDVPTPLRPQPASSRFLVTWNLDQDKAINVGHQAGEPHATQQVELTDDEVQQDRKGKSKATGSRQISTSPSSRPRKSSRRS